MQNFLYRMIWTIFYLIFSLAHFVKTMTVSFHRKLTTYKTVSLEDELKLISQTARQLDKIPSHIVIVLGNERLSMKDLANVVVWCIAAGVSFLSFYDFEGELNKEEANFYNLVNEVHKKYSGNIIWGKKHSSNGVQSPNGTKNGTEFLRKVKVNILSPSDGKEIIVNVTHQLCQSVLEKELKTSDINQDVIDKMIQAHSGVPDPEVAVLFGSLCCTYGLSPWQIRVTEFVQVHSHHNMSVNDFISVLHKYNKCEQRLGK